MQSNLYSESLRRPRAGRFTERRAWRILAEEARAERRACARARRSMKAAFLALAMVTGGAANAAEWQGARCDTDSACMVLEMRRAQAPDLVAVFSDPARLSGFVCHWRGGAVTRCGSR